MTKQHSKLPISTLENLNTPGAGYDVIRYLCMPKVFGSDAELILYFIGKNLARSFDIQTINDVFHIAERVGWGRLEFVKENKRGLTFQLMSDAVYHRLKAPFVVDFRLESGFISEAVAQIRQRECECIEKVRSNIHLVEFQVTYTS